MTEYSPAVQQAFRDWNENRAYLDNGGNYRVRPEAATPTHRPKGRKIAPWNKEVKRLFSDSGEFHRAAQKAKANGYTAGPVLDAGLSEWRIELSNVEGWYIVDAQGNEVIRDTYAPKSLLEQIVRDHNAVAGLVGALTTLRGRVSDGSDFANVIDAALTKVRR
jgi:hypothetical protein